MGRFPALASQQVRRKGTEGGLLGLIWNMLCRRKEAVPEWRMEPWPWCSILCVSSVVSLSTYVTRR